MSSVTPVAYSAEQREAIHHAIECPLSIVTGGPGCGKSTVTQGIVEAWQRRFHTRKEKIVLCSPTGKAAKRLAECAGLPAATIHRTLGWNGEEKGFQHNLSNPLDAELIIVDECSMVDLLLFRDLLRAIPKRAHVVLVGDADQLAPVGPGKPFLDLIESRQVPVTRLTHVYRQATGSPILDAAYAVRDGRIPAAPPDQTEYVQRIYPAVPDPETGLLKHGSAETKRRIALVTLEAVRWLHEKLSLPPNEIQVLTPEKRGECGTDALNRRLRALLNPSPASEFVARPEQDGDPGLRFGVGDRIIQTVNDYGLGVFNGEVGTVTYTGQVTVTEGVGKDRHQVTREGMIVRYEDGTGYRDVAYSRANAREVQHAWALTVHKCQGSEFQAVVVALPWSYLLCTRRLVYTALTRGRQHVVLLAEDGALERTARNAGLDRATTLAERIHGPTAPLPNAGLGDDLQDACPAAIWVKEHREGKRSHRYAAERLVKP